MVVESNMIKVNWNSRTESSGFGYAAPSQRQPIKINKTIVNNNVECGIEIWLSNLTNDLPLDAGCMLGKLRRSWPTSQIPLRTDSWDLWYLNCNIEVKPWNNVFGYTKWPGIYRRLGDWIWRCGGRESQYILLRSSNFSVSRPDRRVNSRPYTSA